MKPCPPQPPGPARSPHPGATRRDVALVAAQPWSSCCSNASAAVVVPPLAANERAILALLLSGDCHRLAAPSCAACQDSGARRAGWAPALASRLQAPGHLVLVATERHGADGDALGERLLRGAHAAVGDGAGCAGQDRAVREARARRLRSPAGTHSAHACRRQRRHHVDGLVGERFERDAGPGRSSFWIVGRRRHEYRTGASISCRGSAGELLRRWVPGTGPDHDHVRGPVRAPVVEPLARSSGAASGGRVKSIAVACASSGASPVLARACVEPSARAKPSKLRFDQRAQPRPSRKLARSGPRAGRQPGASWAATSRETAASSGRGREARPRSRPRPPRPRAPPRRATSTSDQVRALLLGSRGSRSPAVVFSSVAEGPQGRCAGGRRSGFAPSSRPRPTPRPRRAIGLALNPSERSISDLRGRAREAPTSWPPPEQLLEDRHRREQVPAHRRRVGEDAAQAGASPAAARSAPTSPASSACR